MERGWTTSRSRCSKWKNFDRKYFQAAAKSGRLKCISIAAAYYSSSSRPYPSTSLSPKSQSLFVYTTSIIYVLDVGSGNLLQSPLSSQLPNIKWICHPLVNNHILGLRSSHIQIVSWEDLQEVFRCSFRPDCREENPVTHGADADNSKSEQTQ